MKACKTIGGRASPPSTSHSDMATLMLGEQLYDCEQLEAEDFGKILFRQEGGLWFWWFAPIMIKSQKDSEYETQPVT